MKYSTSTPDHKSVTPTLLSSPSLWSTHTIRCPSLVPNTIGLYLGPVRSIRTPEKVWPLAALKPLGAHAHDVSGDIGLAIAPHPNGCDVRRLGGDGPYAGHRGWEAREAGTPSTPRDTVRLCRLRCGGLVERANAGVYGRSGRGGH